MTNCHQLKLQPKDVYLTPVCTTEIIAFSKVNTYFEKLNTCLLGLSVDSNSSHLAWVYDIFCKTGVRVPFPIISDRNGQIARKYGMISNDISNTETVRNVFIIDDKGVIRVILVYPMNIGRCIPEIIRILEALQTSEKSKGVMPVNWVPCQPIIQPMPTNIAELEMRNEEIAKNRNGMSWYLSFKNPEQCINAKTECKRLEEK